MASFLAFVKYEMASIPRDPREDLFIKLHMGDIRGLTDNEML